MIFTNFLWKNASVTSHTILTSNPEIFPTRNKVLNDLKNMGANAINVYFLNQGDYGKNQPVNPYAKGKWFDDELDLAELNRWESIIQMCIAMGLNPIFWLFADDSPVFPDAWVNKKQAVSNIITYLVKRFDKYALAWVLGLEVNEWCPYKDKAWSDYYGNILASVATKPCGIHQTTGRWDYAVSNWCYFMMLQYGFGSKEHTASPSTVANMTKDAIISLKKPIIACEYSRYGDSKEAKQAGQAAISAGASGVCNGW